MRHALGNTRMKFIAGAVLLCAASAASAQSVNLVGGGATLPAQGYAGDTSTRLLSPTPDSLLGAFGAANGVSSTYCQTGSGGGKNVMAGGVSGFNVNAACDASVSPTGFGGTGLTQPHFIGTDSPYSAADYQTYRTGHGNVGQPVQVPSVAGAIGIVFNKPQVAQLNLTEAQVCQIFSGQITRWDDSRLSSAIVRAGGAAPTGNISIAYRADGSGTSFGFTNHLSAACGAAAIGGNGVATQFQTNQSYATAAASYLASYAGSLPASGNPGVINAVLANEGSIGYAETANSVQNFTQLASVQSAQGNFVDPSIDFGSAPLPVTVQFDRVISGVDGNGRPTLAALSPETAGCVALVDPSQYAKPASGYPIVAVSYLVGNSRGNGSATAAVRNLLLAPYNSAVRSATTQIGAGTGLSFLDNSDITATRINACVM
jgi:phosphate transport system substrate-binding protein